MEDYETEAEVFAISNHSKQFDYLKDHALELVKKFNLNNQQLSKMLHLSVSEIKNLMNDSGSITNEKYEEIDNKLSMLNFGFEGFDARERVTLILNDLLTDYMLTTESLSKIIYVEEKELINFREKTLLDRNVELKICVNIIFLHFVLHK